MEVPTTEVVGGYGSDIAEGTIVSLTDVTLLSAHTKNVDKEKIILTDSVEDHLIPYIMRNFIDKMYAMSIILYHSGNTSHKLLLQNQLTHTHMHNTYNI
jgi:hypothetical protein